MKLKVCKDREYALNLLIVSISISISISIKNLRYTGMGSTPLTH